MIKGKNAHFKAGAIITGIMLILIIIGMFWTPYDPNAMNGAEKMAAPSMRHLFGTDNLVATYFPE